MPKKATAQVLLAHILPHVAFDGWSKTAFEAAAREANLGLAEAHGLCPQGARSLARLHHLGADERLPELLATADLSDLRYSEKVAQAILLRLQAAGDREIIRRSVAFYSSPLNAPEGAQLVWGTADAIWNALGDTSEDANWYSKRAILAGVYSASLLYWLGDDSENHTATRAFVDRRVGDVMTFERFKAQARSSRLLKPFVQGIESAMSGVRKPAPRAQHNEFPGTWRG